MPTQSFPACRRFSSPILLAATCFALLSPSFHTVTTILAADAPAAFVGNWALTIPGGGAGWLGIVEKEGNLQGTILWGGGSVLPVDGVRVEGDKLIVTRVREAKRKDKAGVETMVPITTTITGSLSGEKLDLTLVTTNEKGKPLGAVAEFKGQRIPPLPPAPDLSQVKFGEPIELFNGKDLSGWEVTSPDLPNGWSAKDGVLVNHAPQEEGGPHKRYTNIRTQREFEDFQLTLETRVPEKGNSGVYLRGIYEVQISDTQGQPLDAHNMGAIYSRIAPTVAAEKPAGQWQSMKITLVDRHVTVVLNGETIIDNQPILGCTGGAMWSDEFRPGPIYLQGDHTSVEYRNMVLRPVGE
ncbi:MAG: DUF1080 domain-containing protein [Rhodopirellula sp.]|nr:DUF1080 domain-containing protein [Rhodopirellula sp.]